MSQSQSSLQEVLKASESLPPFPDVIWKVMPLIRDMAPVNEIESVIRFDPVITAKVLAFSQSAHYARRQPIVSLRDAIVYLGQQQLIQVITAACSAHYFAGEIQGYDLREGELWEHAVATALMTEIVGRHLGMTNLLTAYTAALLHDIGKTVMNRYVKSSFEAILAMVRDRKLRFLDAEREVVGIDHQQLGTLIGRQWKLPEEIVMAIGHHHSPRDVENPEHRKLVSLIHVCNRMVLGLGIGCGVDGFLQPNHDQVFEELGITSRMVDRFLADLMEALGNTREFLAS